MPLELAEALTLSHVPVPDETARRLAIASRYATKWRNERDREQINRCSSCGSVSFTESAA